MLSEVLDARPQAPDRFTLSDAASPQEQMRGLLAAMDRPRKGSLLRLGPRRLECAQQWTARRDVFLLPREDRGDWFFPRD